MRTIYILLTRTNTVFSRLIHQATGSEYTHVSLSMDSSLDCLYSFARRNLYFPLNAGFVVESLHTGIFGQRKNTPCALYEIKVSEQTYRRVDLYMQAFKSNRQDYDYNFLGLFLCLFDIPLRRKHHFFCSQFVAEVLENTGALHCHKIPSLMRPSDFHYLSELNPIYQGTISQCLMFLGEAPAISEEEVIAF